MQQLEDLAREHNAAKIITVRLAIGRLSGIVIDSFEFGFEVLAPENPLTRGAEMVITVTEPELQCCNCGMVRPVQQKNQPACAKCQATETRFVGGDEIILTRVEME